MLSRVAAAVKAPRTHSRRRVTGSSGRRREGRESEPQRPNMSRNLFCSAVLLLIVVMMCCGSGVAEQAEEQASESTFEWKDIKDVEGEGVTVESLGVPGLLNVGSDVFAVAEAQWKKNSEGDSFTGIASQIITKDNANSPVEVLKEVKVTQFLEDDASEDPKKKVDVSRPTTIVEGSDIYMLVGKYSPADVVVPPKNDAEHCGLLLVKGEVSDQSSKRIKWSYANAVPHASLGEQRQSWTELIGGGGSGVRMDDGTLVFPVEGTKKGDTENDEKAVSLLICTSDNAASWKLSKEAPDGGCSDPSVVEWGEEDKKLIMMTACDGGRRRVYESDDKGEEWTEALGTLSRVWGNKKGEEAKGVRSGFVTAKIGGDEDKRNVMLVTLPVYSKKDESKKEKGELHLWLTDNTHIVDIGPVSGDDDAAASSLLYKSGKDGDNNEKEELIALYEKNDERKPSPGMVSVLLTEQLQRVKEVLATWKKVDERVSKLCPSESNAKDGSPGDACSPTGKITDGLVGFLSGKFSENTWRDEYLGVNATVKGNGDGGNKATLHASGVKFTGAWAEWPVGAQGENQLYHFANYNFTLVATVSIHGETQEGSPISLMGAKINDDNNPVLLGLSYDSEKKRIVFCGGEQNKEHSSNWEPGTTHQLAIVLQNGKQGSAYVDGILVGNAQCNLQDMDSKAVSHFYIGGDGGAKSDSESRGGVSVTVRNVLLYNRPLSTAEIGALNPNKASTPSVVPDNGQGTVSQSSSAGQPPSEQGQPKGSIDAGAGGASTPATSTAAASSGQEPVNQLTYGTSPSGNKNADVSSSSDADPTVVTVGGETVQGDGSLQTHEVSVSSGEDEEATGRTDGQEEGIHSQHGEVKAAALSSRLGNVSQGNNSDAGTVRGSGLLPSLLLLLGLWVFAAL
ncbi:putative trans-sialidase, Group V [Trypanosoma cruzi]|nr:putative trans-sialidase, Group V [Trypanosoma cruzi]